MNIFDAILKAIDDCYYFDSGLKLPFDNSEEIEKAKKLVEQLRDQIKNLQPDEITHLVYATGFAACRGKILNMEVEND